MRLNGKTLWFKNTWENISHSNGTGYRLIGPIIFY